MKALKILLILLLLGGASAATVMYSGIVNVAADEPHS
ncbi:MAG TPA: cytochrome C oxidase Cbb3, partial [Pseudoalteromonas sp.]|nr:cytochrome C oxidase Cbb3 [Pseudoalteromonas sp.]